MGRGFASPAMVDGRVSVTPSELIALFLSRAGQLAAAFATIKIATTLLSPAEVGSVNQLNSYGMFFAVVVLLPVIAYFARGATGWIGADRFARNARVMLYIIALAAFALSAAGMLLQWGWGLIHEVGAAWVGFLLLVFLIGFPTHQLVVNCTAVLGRRIRTAIHFNVAAWSGLAAAVILYLQFKTAEAWFLGICIGFALSGQGFWSVLRDVRNSRTSTVAEQTVLPFNVKAVVRFIWPQILVGVLWWIQSQSYRFQLAEISTLATVGLFFAAYALCAVPIQAFEAAVNEFYAPLIYGKANAASEREVVEAWNRYASVYVPFILIFGGFIAACAPFLVIVALGSEFQAVAAVVLWPALAETVRALSTVNHTLGIAKVDMRRLLPPALAGAIATPALIQVLAPDAPLLGTAVAFFSAHAIVLCVVYVLTRLSVPVTWPWRRALAAAASGTAMILAGNAAFALLPRTATIALAVCTALGLFMLALLYYFGRNSFSGLAVKHEP
jgi:O-antigen/teichoic acid export membrane protein